MQNEFLNKIFSYLIIYYWILVYIQKPPYIVITLPIALFIFYLLLDYIKNFSLDRSFSPILMFVLFSGYLTISRSDFSSFSALALLGLMIFFIDEYKLHPSLRLINRLFFISIIVSIPLFYSGYSYYGFLPGQGGASHDEFLAGRVSLFPNVTTSLYFSFIVFILNYFFNKNSYQKYILFIFSLYFIYFGISRTLMILISFIVFFTFIFRAYPLDKNIFYQLFLPIVLIFLPIVAVINIENIISFLLNLHNDFISEYFFRGYDSVDKILDDIARTRIWSEHIRLFLEYPWGLSSNEILANVNPDIHLSDGGGSESFLTRILMRYGFGAIFLYLYIASLLNRAIENKNSYLYIFVYIFIFIGVTYGSFFAAYNMLFLIFMSSINYKYKDNNL